MTDSLARLHVFCFSFAATELVLCFVSGTRWSTPQAYVAAFGLASLAGWIAAGLAFLAPRRREHLFRRAAVLLLGFGALLIWLQRLAWTPAQHHLRPVVWLAVTIALAGVAIAIALLPPRLVIILVPLIALGYQVSKKITVHQPLASLTAFTDATIAATVACAVLLLADLFGHLPTKTTITAATVSGAVGVFALVFWTHASFAKTYASNASHHPPAATAPNVIVIVVDTLRADRLTPYGYTVRLTSPFLRRFAGEGEMYTNAYSSTSWTVPAVATLFTGEAADRHGVTVFGRSLPGRPLLAEELRRRGYTTLAVSTNPLLAPRLGFNRGFDRFVVLSRLMTVTGSLTPSWCDVASVSQYWQGEDVLPRLIYDWNGKPRAEQAVDVAVDEIDRARGRQPFFLYLHLLDPHHLCDAPQSPATDNWQPSAADGNFDRHWSVQYDREIRYVDDQLQRLVDALSRRVSDRSTVILITADHGEQLGEQGERGHGINLKNAVVRVPLLLRAPGISPGINKEPFTLAQVRPLLLSFVDAARQSPEQQWPVMAHLRSPLAPEVTLRSVQSENWKLIQTISASGKREALYQLPDENHDRLRSFASVASSLRDRLPQTLDVLSAEEAAKIRSFGYIQ